MFLSNCFIVGTGGAVALMKLNKCINVKVLNITSNMLFACCTFRREFLVETNLEFQASEKSEPCNRIIDFFDLSSLKERIIFYFTMAQNVITSF